MAEENSWVEKSFKKKKDLEAYLVSNFPNVSVSKQRERNWEDESGMSDTLLFLYYSEEDGEEAHIGTWNSQERRGCSFKKEHVAEARESMRKLKERVRKMEEEELQEAS